MTKELLQRARTFELEKRRGLPFRIPPLGHGRSSCRPVSPYRWPGKQDLRDNLEPDDSLTRRP